jgi:predicted AlkP superfamily phosphohydrolase/phosphomutase
MSRLPLLQAITPALLLALAGSCAPLAATPRNTPRNTPSAPARAIATSPAAAPAVTSIPTNAVAQRVVLVSFDGLGADELAENLSSLSGGGVERLAPEGTTVFRVLPVQPSVTSATHTAILTGSRPNVNGVVANRFHIAGTPLREVADGFGVDINAETLIDSARKAGKRVGCITFPTVDARTPRRAADFGMLYVSRPTVPARILHLKRADFHSEWLPPTWGAPQAKRTSFSPVLRAHLDWSLPQGQEHRDVELVAYDSTDDHQVNYDTFGVELDGRDVPLDAQRWFAISASVHEEEGQRLYGSWSKIMKSDPALEEVTLYWGSISRTIAYPEAFQQQLDATVGFWPGPPDEISARDWMADRTGIDVDTFIEQSRRFSAYFTDATALAIRQWPFDLLLAYQPVIDQTEHQFHVTNDLQWNATAENRAASDRARHAAYQTMNGVVASVARNLDPSHDALVITGDHGLASVDTEVRVNRLLADAGLVTQREGQIADDTRWAAYSSGGVSEIYHFGNVSEEETQQVVNLLTNAKAPDGAAIFEAVLRKDATSHPNTGDVVAIAYPRFALSSILGAAFARTSYYGQHGGLASHHELHTTLLAWGRGVPVAHLAEISQTRIARFIATLLGIAPPANAE